MGAVALHRREARVGCVIPVKRKPVPKGFNAKVYRPGRRWLKKKGLPLHGPVPKGNDGKDIPLKPYWRKCLRELHRRYEGVCAYVSIYIPRVTGSSSVDHFIAKSSSIEHAYRWRNFRLACGKINGRKGIFDDLLDPFEIKEGTFHLNLLTGAISPNPTLPPPLKAQAQATIDRLGLNDADCCLDRLEFFDDYRKKQISSLYLKEKCPFVWYEVHRQKMTV